MHLNQIRREIGFAIQLSRRSNDPPWTRQDYADALGCTTNRILNIEKGKTSVKAEELAILHCVFALDLCRILPDFSPPHQPGPETSDGP